MDPSHPHLHTQDRQCPIQGTEQRPLCPLLSLWVKDMSLTDLRPEWAPARALPEDLPSPPQCSPLRGTLVSPAHSQSAQFFPDSSVAAIDKDESALGHLASREFLMEEGRPIPWPPGQQEAWVRTVSRHRRVCSLGRLAESLACRSSGP